MSYCPCQEHICSLFFSFKVWRLSHSYSSILIAVTDLMCCCEPTGLSLQCWWKLTHMLTGGKVPTLLVCCVCVSVPNSSCVTEDFARGGSHGGRNKCCTGLKEWYLEISYSVWPLAAKRAPFYCSGWLYINSFVQSTVRKIYLLGFLCYLSLKVPFYCTKDRKINQPLLNKTEADSCPRSYSPSCTIWQLLHVLPKH